MDKASIWTLLVCKLINSIPESGHDAVALKNKLLEEFRITQNPSEAELVKFQSIITLHESIITAREFKGETEIQGIYIILNSTGDFNHS